MYVTVVVPMLKLLPLAFVTDRETAPLLLSVAVGVLHDTATVFAEPVFCVMAAGHVILGGCLSCTTTLNVHVFWLPLASFAVYCTVVVPIAKLPPGECVAVSVGTAPLLSVGLGTVHVAWPVAWSCFVFTVTVPGHVRLGASLSCTTTEKVQLAWLLEASVAVALTVVVPMLNCVPLAGE